MRSMTHQSFDSPAARPIEAGAHVAHLRHVLGIVHEMAEFAERGGAAYHALDQAARISAAYERSLPVVRRRFDAVGRGNRDLDKRGAGSPADGPSVRQPTARCRRTDWRRSWTTRSPPWPDGGRLS
jgi:hypothetical protein